MNNKSIIYIVLGLLLVGGLFMLMKPKQTPAPNPSPTPVSIPTTSKSFELKVIDKKLVSGPETLIVNEGDDVTITITSDIAEEFHLHGYDKSIELEKDKATTLSFKATLTGRFVFELEHSKTDIGVLEVLPK